MRPGGIFRWRWRLGLFDNPTQVANALHVLKGLSVVESLELVEQVQAEIGDPAPGTIWREARKRLKERKR